MEPASYYVFRLFAKNTIGIGKPSGESQQLHVPGKSNKTEFLILEFLPEDPFYTKWWFLVIIFLCSLIVIMVFVATLCFTNKSNAYKSDKNHAFNTLQLSDGGIVSYELHSKHLKRYKFLNYIKILGTNCRAPTLTHHGFLQVQIMEK